MIFPLILLGCLGGSGSDTCEPADSTGCATTALAFDLSADTWHQQTYDWLDVQYWGEQGAFILHLPLSDVDLPSDGTVSTTRALDAGDRVVVIPSGTEPSGEEIWFCDDAAEVDGHPWTATAGAFAFTGEVDEEIDSHGASTWTYSGTMTLTGLVLQDDAGSPATMAVLGPIAISGYTPQGPCG